VKAQAIATMRSHPADTAPVIDARKLRTNDPKKRSNIKQ
jgi:hypothetical protein